MVLFTGDGSAKFFINLPMAGINAAITNYFVMFFRDMPDETLDKVHNWNGFFHILVILMPVVMESNKLAVIGVNPGSGDDRPSKIASDVLHDRFWVAFIRFGVDIEAVFVFCVTMSLYFFEGWSNLRF